MTTATTTAKLAITLDSLSASGQRILVVGRGSAARQALRACQRHGIADLFVTGFASDANRAQRIAGANVALLGKTESPALWRNAHALIEAAKACGASTLLYADRNSEPSRFLLSQAALMGWDVLRPLEGDRSCEFWEPCALPASVKPWQPRWRSCPKCRLSFDVSQEGPLAGCCPECGKLFRIDSAERIDATFDAGSFEEWDAQMTEPDPLRFPGYEQTLERNRVKSGKDEGVCCGRAKLYGLGVATCIMDSTFMMGSMGSVVGEKITRAIERATAERLPLIIFTASGGARMQEGLASLMQMAKTTAALEAHGRAGLPYFSVITDPTTGGVTASFAMLGDVIIAEPGALIGFAGRRVIQDTIKQTLPEGFQSAEFALEHGLIDDIVERSELRGYLAQLVRLHMASAPGGEDNLYRDLLDGTHKPAGTSASDAAPRITVKKSANFALNIAGGIGKALKAVHNLGQSGKAQQGDLAAALRRRGVADAPGVAVQAAGSTGANAAWDNVQLARNVARPTSSFYINAIFDSFTEMHGDREYADDGAIMCGIAWLAGKPVTVIAEEKGADLQQRIARSFGCPHPEGYRKAMRAMEQAEKFSRPVICLVDTQGAYCGKDAEEHGMGAAIATSMQTLAKLTVPVVSVVIGEGGSGGALALAVANRVAMQEHAVYSVLSPEGFASILWKDGSKAPQAAEVMKMSAAEVRELGIVEEVLSEGDRPAHINPNQAALCVKDFLLRSLRELSPLSGEELREQRYQRFRKY